MHRNKEGLLTGTKKDPKSVLRRPRPVGCGRRFIIPVPVIADVRSPAAIPHLTPDQPVIMSSKKEQKPKRGLGAIMKKAAIVWFVLYVYSMTPSRWTSPKRVILETIFRMGMPIIALDPYASLNGRLPRLDPEELLPVETPPSVVSVLVLAHCCGAVRVG